MMILICMTIGEGLEKRRKGIIDEYYCIREVMVQCVHKEMEPSHMVRVLWRMMMLIEKELFVL